MIEPVLWIERQFNFDFPPGYFPSVFERLIGTPSRVRELVIDEADSKLVQKPGGKWSVKEHVGHLNDLEELHERRLNEFLEGKDELSPADMKNERTTAANHNSGNIGDLVALFSTTRHAFAHRVLALNDEILKRTSFHPRLKRNIRLMDMILFMCDHDDHHLAKIRSLLNENTTK